MGEGTIKSDGKGSRKSFTKRLSSGKTSISCMSIRGQHGDSFLIQNLILMIFFILDDEEKLPFY